MEKAAIDKIILRKVRALTVNDLGTQHIEDLEKICGDSDNVFSSAFLGEALQKLEAEAKIAGTYLEDCDGLWEFTRSKLPEEEDKQLALFTKISRKTLRRCYKDIFDQLSEKLELDPFPEPAMRSLGTPRSVEVKATKDIFNNEWNNQRAHLIPNSPVCAPKWGHSAEGALKPLSVEDAKKNDARKLLVMGHARSPKLRQKAQNLIKFSAHKEVFDVYPTVVIIPIMSLDDVLSWEETKAYEALVIASKIKKPGRDEPYTASSTYKQILSHFEYKDSNFCTPEDIATATTLIHAFLLGHAASLAAGIPMSIDPDKSDKERKGVLDELEKVQKDITTSGVALPCVHVGKHFRKVLKVHFLVDDTTAAPDPWLLATKGAVNLSSTRGQKLLPACENDEEEDDDELLQELWKYQMRRRLTNLPVEVNCHEIGEASDTPSQANRRDRKSVV